MAYDQAVKAHTEFEKMLSNRTSTKSFTLCVICSSEREDKSVFASALSRHRRHLALDPANVDENLRTYLISHFKYQPSIAALRDEVKDGLNVRVITSDRAGTGKSLYVKRQIEKCSHVDPKLRSCCISIKKQTVPFEDVYERLKAFERGDRNDDDDETDFHRVYHLDIAYEVWYEVDYLLFNLMCLGVIESKSGGVFRRRDKDLFFVEIMAPKFKVRFVCFPFFNLF